MVHSPRKGMRRARTLSVILFLSCSFLAWIAVSGHDETALRSFAEAVDRWQVNPEFRAVAMDYCVRGSAAMRTKILGMPAKKVIIALRSTPMIPKKYAVNPTSRQHYEDFSRGPLSAYLHLCSEQDVPDMVGVFEVAGRKTGRTRDDLLQALSSFKMDFPLTTDAGARQSVDDLLRDADAARPFTIRQNIGPLLAAPIGELAAELNIPADPDSMTADQQSAVIDRLDPVLRAHHYELWRTKQASDFCSGIWAQVYGPPYKGAIVPVLKIHKTAEILLIMTLAALVYFEMRRAGKNAEPVVAENSDIR
jgi:hypothetical protein